MGITQRLIFLKKELFPANTLPAMQSEWRRGEGRGRGRRGEGRKGEGRGERVQILISFPIASPPGQNSRGSPLSSWIGLSLDKGLL